MNLVMLWSTVLLVLIAILIIQDLNRGLLGPRIIVLSLRIIGIMFMLIFPLFIFILRVRRIVRLKWRHNT